MMTGRSFDRFVNFTDAVVAIAITLLVLPLLDVAGPQVDETVWTVLSNNTGPLLAFALAFGLVAQNWLIHNRIVNIMRGFNGPVFWLNIGWIAAIALMPWTAAMYGAAGSQVEGGEGYGGTGMLFFVVLAALSGFMLAVSIYLGSHRFLLEPDRVAEWERQAIVGRWRLVAIIIALLACGVTSLFIPGIGAYMPLLVFPFLHVAIRIIERRRGQVTEQMG
jgi:uncharacterized membrane protein